MSHKIVFLDRETVDARVRSPNFTHSYTEYAVTSADDVVARLQGATIAITNKVPLRADTLSQLPDLKLIAVAATGTDVIDKAYTQSHGVTVVNIRNYAFNTVPEHVIALMFALRRNLVAYRDDVRTGAWQKARQFCFFSHPIHDIAGSTLGIVGYGAIGKSIARRAEALGMTVIAYDVIAQPGLVDFATILKESDVITLHTPLTPETRNMIGAEQLAAMKRSAILINTARGGLVDEAALAHALKTGVIAGAGFDVLTVEPPKTGNVLLDADLPNFILTPHVAWASQEAMQILADQLIDNIEAFVAGKPQNVVTA
ncbi:MAG: D-2-hydroxyacid dehydrogenase [Methylocystis sp.]|nr:D-2-hydroxyacid dehydrogenase [Methylocystis sp.]